MATTGTIDVQPESRAWTPPAQVTVRGTVAVIPGRGETAAVYERFGARLAADGYLVHAVVGLSDAHLADALSWLAVDAPAPFVVAGADTGALHALAASVEVDAVAGVVLAGTPGSSPAEDSGQAALDWDDEVQARSACPVHRGRLDAEVVRGALTTEPVPADLQRAAYAARPRVPVLLLHGAADTIAPVAGARDLATALPAARLVTVLDGRHDVLNDVSHRSVAAEIVQFLERLRISTEAAPILHVEVA